MKTKTHTYTAEEQNLKCLWRILQVTEEKLERRGLQFGQAVYNLREKYKIQGTRNDLSPSDDKLEGYLDVLNKLGIPEATARRWRIRYEEAIGTRQPKPDPNPRPDKPIPIPAVTPVVTPTPAPPTPTRTKEDVDREGLQWLVQKRLPSVIINFQQVLDKKAKWSKYPEYAEVVSLGEKIVGLVNLL